jgi:large subunit ribosomal protein L30
MAKTNEADLGDSNSSLLVVNLRGMVNTRTPVRKTLNQLRVRKRFNATIVPKSKIYLGMLRSAKEHVAWCEIDSKTAQELLSKRAETSDGKRFAEESLKGSEYSSFSDLASALAAGKTSLEANLGLRQFFRLAPPRGGFKRSVRRQYGEGGILGPNKELSQIVEKMM